VTATTSAKHLREAHTALVRLLDRSAGDDALLTDLDQARLEMAAAGQTLGSSSPTETAVIEEIAHALTTLRDPLVESIARQPNRSKRMGHASFVASRGVPALHQAGAIPVLHAFAPPRAWDADPPSLASGPASSRAPTVSAESAAYGGAHTATGTQLELEPLARDALEDIGIFGNLRRLEGFEPWVDARGFEERLLANLDALWALDAPLHPDVAPVGVMMASVRYVTEFAVPDWGRAFAFAFAVGCSRQSGTKRSVIVAMQRTAPAILSAFVDALSLASGPDVADLILPFLGGSSAPLAEAALRIASRRRIFNLGVMTTSLAHPDEAVVLAAIECLRHAPSSVARELLTNLSVEHSPRVQVAILRERAAHGDRSVLPLLRAEVDQCLRMPEPTRGPNVPAAKDALRVLALVGDPADEQRVRTASLALPDSAHWLGFHGYASHLEPLLGQLREVEGAGETDRLRRARLRGAVFRLTGLSADLTADGLRDQALEQLAAAGSGRVRLGKPYQRDAVLAELLSPEACRADRQDLALEHAIGWPTLPRLDVETWVAAQAAELASVRAMKAPPTR
jgi:hypothetical protein